MFISLSIVLERMQYEGVVDVFQTVRTLRTQRPAMVQTEVSLIFSISILNQLLACFKYVTDLAFLNEYLAFLSNNLAFLSENSCMKQSFNNKVDRKRNLLLLSH